MNALGTLVAADPIQPAYSTPVLLVIALLAVLPLIYASWRNLAGSWRSNEFYDGLLGIPRWPMKLAFLLGLVIMTIRLALVALEDALELRRTGTVTTHTEEESV